MPSDSNKYAVLYHFQNRQFTCMCKLVKLFVLIASPNFNLSAGGFMVLVQLCINENGYSLGKTNVKFSMFDVMDSIMKEMMEFGIITEVSGNQNPKINFSGHIYMKKKLIKNLKTF